MPAIQATKVARDPRKGDQFTATLNTQNYSTECQLTDSYTVTFPNSSATPLDAWAANDGTNFIPIIGTPYDDTASGSQMICVGAVPSRDSGNPCIWRVQVTFKNIIPQPDSSQSDKWNINIKVKPVSYEEDASSDVNQLPVVNVNGDRFNPAVKRVYYDKDYCVSFTTGNAQPCLNAIDACEGHYNDAPVTMSVNGVTRKFPKGTLLFVSPDYDTIRVGKPPYKWNFSYMFRYRRETTPGRGDGWKTYIANRGYRYVNAAGKMVNAQDSYGVFHGEPVNLALDGTALPQGAKPIFLTFDFYGPADFTQLLNGIQ